MRKLLMLIAIGLTLSLQAAHAGMASNTCQGREQCDVLSSACNSLRGEYIEVDNGKGIVLGQCTIYW